ncbi:MCP four helix bundle domain-containing protein [Desulfomicrobium salsuginis]
MKNIKLGPKLIGGFCLTAIVALAIGLSGISGMRDLSENMDDIGHVSLPSVEYLLRTKGSLADLPTNLPFKPGQLLAVAKKLLR